MVQKLVLALDRTGRLQTTRWNDVGPIVEKTAHSQNRFQAGKMATTRSLGSSLTAMPPHNHQACALSPRNGRSHPTP